MATDEQLAPPVPTKKSVGIQDKPTEFVRNPSDLVGVIGCACGIVLVCAAVIFAHNTTSGISQDVRGFAVLLQRLLFAPVAALDTLVILFPPLAVGIDLLVRRHPLVALRGLLGGIAGLILAIASVFLITAVAPQSLLADLSMRVGGVDVVSIPPHIAAITALLTAVATPVSRRSITWSWNLMWVSVVVGVVTATQTLPGVGIALLLGRMAGYAMRYTLGVASQRAYGQALVEGIRRAGFDPISLDRVSVVRVVETSRTRPGVQSPQFFPDHRLYVMQTASQELYNVIVLDGDRQMMSTLNRMWRFLRSRAISGRTIVSLRQTAERTALISYSARSAGVRTPAVLAIAEAAESMLIIREATPASVSFADLEPTQVTDKLLDSMWDQMRLAHGSGVTHRVVTPDCFRVSPSGGKIISTLGWEAGDVASSELAQRIDLTQMMAVMATKVSPQRILASAGRVLDEEDLSALGPLLQVPAIPKQTRDLLKDPKASLAQLRTRLTERHPDAQVEPEKIVRVGARSLIMITLVTVALIVILTSFNLAEIVEAVRNSDWRWAVGAFGIGMVGFLGSSLTMVAFSPVKINYWRALLCQVSTSFIAVATPVGIGPAALNVRFLTKKRVSTAVAAATAALIQVSNAVVIILVLAVLTAATGTNQIASVHMSPGVLIALISVAFVVAVMASIPRTRAWMLTRVLPILKQTWPRLVELFSSPTRLALGLLGHLVFTLCYVLALQWTVYAFGLEISFFGAALVYVVGFLAGSAIPTPGGLGPIEVALSAALVSLGINPGVAASIVLLFRFVTYWIRIPIGWLTYKTAERLGDL
ncbi:MAG: flippase-like domain-containing protein [Propionibacteriaceae bacterium]|nr:flippase-like domain-containing protein [Propionibacteriaceae bacterium]